MVKVYMSRVGDWYTVEATGHATGNSKVCSAVSTLIQTLETWINNTGLTHSGTVSAGDSCLKFTGQGSGTVFDTVYCGFRRLAASYPEYIELTAEESAGTRSR